MLCLDGWGALENQSSCAWNRPLGQNNSPGNKFHLFQLDFGSGHIVLCAPALMVSAHGHISVRRFKFKVLSQQTFTRHYWAEYGISAMQSSCSTTEIQTLPSNGEVNIQKQHLPKYHWRGPLRTRWAPDWILKRWGESWCPWSLGQWPLTGLLSADSGGNSSPGCVGGERHSLLSFGWSFGPLSQRQHFWLR